MLYLVFLVDLTHFVVHWKMIIWLLYNHNGAQHWLKVEYKVIFLLSMSVWFCGNHCDFQIRGQLPRDLEPRNLRKLLVASLNYSWRAIGWPENFRIFSAIPASCPYLRFTVAATKPNTHLWQKNYLYSSLPLCVILYLTWFHLQNFSYDWRKTNRNSKQTRAARASAGNVPKALSRVVLILCVIGWKSRLPLIGECTVYAFGELWKCEMAM